MKYHIKSTSKLQLMKFLKRRKMTLKKFLLEQGVSTYFELKNICFSFGVECPTEEQFNSATIQEIVTNQSEGVVVIEPLPIFNENGQRIDNDDINNKKRRQKKQKSEEETKI